MQDIPRLIFEKSTVFLFDIWMMLDFFRFQTFIQEIDFIAPRSRPAPLRPALRLLAAAALAASAPALAQAQAHAQTQAQDPAQQHAQPHTRPQPQTKAEEEQTASPEHTMPPVIVRARRLARDGVSESTAYTTRGVQVAGKTPRALREIPQSVSVFTEQRLRDQAQVDGARVLE